MPNAVSIRILDDTALRQFRRTALDKFCAASARSDLEKFSKQVADATGEMNRRARLAK